MRTMNALDGILLALNKVPGLSFVELIARNPDIDTATVPETIWPVGSTYSFRTSGAIVEVVSDSADDAAAGTGARTIVIEGLDEDYKPISETITLNGITAVDGTKLFFRINDAYVLGHGSGGTNAGNITLRDNGAGTTRSYIAAGRGRAEDGVYTVPAGQTLVLLGWYAASRDASGVSNADIDVRERHNDIDGAWHVAWSFNVDKVFNSPFQVVGHPFREKTDIELRATAAGANNTVVSFHGHAILVGENAL